MTLRELAKKIQAEFNKLPEWKKGHIVFDPPKKKGV